MLSQLLGQWWQRCLLLVVVLLLYPLARIGLGFALRQLRSLWWVLAAIAVAQIVFAGWRLAVSVVATIALLVLAAGLVTLTTTTTALSDVVVRVLGPFRRFGVAPERVGLLMALSIRAVPSCSGWPSRSVTPNEPADCPSGRARSPYRCWCAPCDMPSSWVTP